MIDNWNKFREFFLKFKDLGSLGLGVLITNAIGGIFWFYMASLLGTEKYGEVSYFISIGIMASTISLMGSTNAIIVYGAKGVKIQPPIFLIVILFSLITSIVLFFIFLNDFSVSLYVIGFVIFTLISSDFLGKKLYRNYAKIIITQKFLMVILAGGFFLSAHKYLTEHYNLDPDEKKFLKEKTFKGWDIVTEVVRLCAMSLFLHGIGDKESQITSADSLISDSGDRFDIIMTNPPFGKKSSTMIFSEAGKAERETLSYERDDFWATTSNKQLNFLQHVKTILKVNGRCSIVVPDNVLFEGGAGETVRRKILEQLNCHTLLRLPTGIFYAGGVKANVLFFDKKPARTDGKAWTEKLWIYDFRTNQHFTLKENTLSREHLDDFVKCYNAKNILKRTETEQFHAYSYDELIKRDKVSLDIFWLKDDSLEDIDNLPPPDVIANEIKENLESALDSINELIDNLGKK